MKTLNDYLIMNYRMEIVEDKDEGGFVVSFPRAGQFGGIFRTI